MAQARGARLRVPPSEAARKLIHIAAGGFAFLLRDLTWAQAIALGAAACVFNAAVLPRIGGKGLWRGSELARGAAPGILFYPLAVLGVVLLFPDEPWIAAAVWGILAFGDGTASLLGQALGGAKLPWNERKSWSGFLAFIVFGTLGSACLAAWTQRLPLVDAWHTGLGVLMLLVVVACALVETLPTTLDDNITVPVVGASLLALFGGVSFEEYLAQPYLLPHLLQGLVVNGVFALAAKRAGSIDWPGAVSAVIVGTLITIGLGLPGLLVMIAFFVIGSAVTRLGYRIKAARGIAQEKGGARGWKNAWANGGVPALLAVLAGIHAAALGGLDKAVLFAIAYAAAVATAAADTCSSEVGKAYGRRTFLITTLRSVPPGTEGAVSLEGTLGGLAGGFLVAAVGAFGGLYPWPVSVLVGFAGLLGSLAESVIGTVAEKRGWLDNDLLNALNTAIGALLAAAMTRLL